MRYVFKALGRTGFLGIVIAFVGLCHTATGQGSGTVRGTVLDKSSGEPILFTNVFLAGTTIGASTDVNGFFTI
ncbi:MAG: carboxypeptidase-like regulatory domain-containing protein, partial [Sphingomonadales bacterium]|nr:carboxypeptidase-like regulatory domain-containing protein [Sphingomonadales bacterium]